MVKKSFDNVFRKTINQMNKFYNEKQKQNLEQRK